MDFAIILRIAMKELEDVSKSKYVLGTMIFMPILFGVLLPAMYILPFAGTLDMGNNSDIDQLTSLIDAELTDDWATLTEAQRMVVIAIQFSVVMFLVLPIFVPTIIAADSFAGEKDRGTAEGLAVAPISDSEIYLGKIMGSFIPTMAGIWLAAIGFVFLANYASKEVLGRNLLPDLNFILSILVVAPLLGIASVNIMIFASTKTSNARDSQQIGSLISLPLMALVFGSFVFMSVYVLLISAGVLIIVDVIAVKIGMSLLNREKWISMV